MEFAQAWVEINAANLRHNLAVIRRQTGEGVSVAGVVKGDAYGHGMLEVAQCLSGPQGLDMIVAGTIDEGIKLREAGIRTPVLLLSPLDAGQQSAPNNRNYKTGRKTVLDALVEYELIPSVYSAAFAWEFHCKCLERGKKMKIHLRVDTNHSGYGLPAGKLGAVFQQLLSLSGLEIGGIYTHLFESYAHSPEESAQQIQVFNQALAGIPREQLAQVTVHAANSKAIFAWPESYYNMVRAGAALYGFPCGGISEGQLRPVFNLKARVVAIGKGYFGYEAPPAGEVGAEDKPAAFVAIGSWDAPFLLASNRGYALVRGKKAPLRGVCMDVTAIDISGADGVRVGDEVLLAGEEIPLGEWIKTGGFNYSNFEKMFYTGKRVQKVVKEEPCRQQENNAS